MTVYKRIINTLVACYALFLASSLHPISRITSLQFLQYPMQLGDSDLQRDEITLTDDIRNLRRHLRHGANQFRIAEERQNIRRDWLNIVLDRRPREIEPDGSATELARSKQLEMFLSGGVRSAHRNRSADLE